jgi:hypothetical protein
MNIGRFSMSEQERRVFGACIKSGIWDEMQVGWMGRNCDG